MKFDVRRKTWYDDSVIIKDHMEPFQYLRTRFNSHNVTGIGYAAQYILRSKYVGWALILNNE